MAEERHEKVIATNRKAFHDYAIEEKLEAGLALKGTEVKALRQGRANLREGYATVEHGEIILHNCHIGEYTHGNLMNHEPLRPRKLLLHRREINRLLGKTKIKGLTLIPLRLYFNPRGVAKVRKGHAGRPESAMALCFDLRAPPTRVLEEPIIIRVKLW